jgi:hypothetical protein
MALFASNRTPVMTYSQSLGDRTRKGAVYARPDPVLSQVGSQFGSILHAYPYDTSNVGSMAQYAMGENLKRTGLIAAVGHAAIQLTVT